MQRPDWYEYFFSMAQKAAERSTCLRRKVGAVAVYIDDFIIGTGYNGPPSKYPHCTPQTCYRTAHQIPSGQHLDKCYAVHAEQNLVAKLGARLRDCTVYVTHQPCITCFKLLLTAGVVCIRWQNPYPDSLAMEMLKATGSVCKSDTLTPFEEWIREDKIPF